MGDPDMKTRILAATMCAAMLCGCGLAETAATGAAAGESAAEQAREGKKLEEKIQTDIANMQQQAKDAQAAAEAESLGE
jgi:hypothetical protein